MSSFSSNSTVVVNNVVHDTQDIQQDSPEHKRHALARFVSAIEWDPIEMTKWLKTYGGNDLDNPREITLSQVYALSDTRKMKNIMETGGSIGMNVMLYFIALTQSGKTNSMMFNLWREGLLHGHPGVLYTHNRSGEGYRMKEDAEKFNWIVTVCAKMLRLQPEEYALLDFYHSEDKRGAEKFITALKENQADKIPVYSDLGNSSRVNKHEDLVEKMSKHLGRDAPTYIDSDGFSANDGAMKAFLVIDEAELLVKPDSAKLSEVLRKPVNLKLLVPNPRSRNPSYENTRKESLLKCFTSVMRVTATPQVFTYKNHHVNSPSVIPRVPPLVITRVQPPSPNYWAYKKEESWLCKQVTCVNAPTKDGWKVMVQHMMSDIQNTRHGMCASVSRVKDQETKAKTAAREFPNLLTCAWNGKGIRVFTTCESMASELRGTGAFVGTVIDGSVHCFKSLVKSTASQEWEDGVLKNSKICTYRGLMTFISNKCLPQVPKTLLFAKDMVMRSVPVKAYDHSLPLTDMFHFVSSQVHDENIIQLLGRLTGNDTRTQLEKKYLWGSESLMSILENALNVLPTFVGLINEGKTWAQVADEMKTGLESMRNESMNDPHRVNATSLGHRTRKLREVDVAIGKRQKLTTRATRFGVGFNCPELEGRLPRVEVADIAPVAPVPAPAAPIPAPVAPVAVPVATAVPTASLGGSAPPIGRRFDAPQEDSMMEVWNNHKDEIAQSMKKAVVVSLGSADVRRMSERIQDEDSFPDGTNFSNMTLFVNTICVLEEALQKSGLKFENGVFSLRRELFKINEGIVVGVEVKNYLVGKDWVDKSELVRAVSLLTGENNNSMKNRIWHWGKKSGVTGISNGLFCRQNGRGWQYKYVM